MLSLFLWVGKTGKVEELLCASRTTWPVLAFHALSYRAAFLPRVVSVHSWTTKTTYQGRPPAEYFLSTSGHEFDMDSFEGGLCIGRSASNATFAKRYKCKCKFNQRHWACSCASVLHTLTQLMNGFHIHTAHTQRDHSTDVCDNNDKKGHNELGVDQDDNSASWNTRGVPFYKS